jgi:hypothetical protein
MICAENKKQIANSARCPILMSTRKSGSGRCQEATEGRRRQKAETLHVGEGGGEDDAIQLAMSLILATESNEEIAMKNEIPRL